MERYDIKKKLLRENNIKGLNNIISSEIDSEIRGYIYESLGISDDITLYGNNFTKHIINQALSIYKESSTSYWELEGQYNFWGNTVSYKVDIYFFEKQRDLNLFSKFNTVRNNFDLDKKELTLTIFFVGETPVLNIFKDSLFHELEHMYQFLKGGKNIFKKRKSLYDFCMGNLKGIKSTEQFSEEYFIFWVSYCIYLSFKFEQVGFNHGLYGEMASKYENGEQNLNSLWKNTEYYKILNRLRKFSIIFDEYRDNMNLLSALYNFSKYNMTYDKISDLISSNISKFTYNMGRTVTKFKQDYKLDENIIY